MRHMKEALGGIAPPMKGEKYDGLPFATLAKFVAVSRLATCCTLPMATVVRFALGDGGSF